MGCCAWVLIYGPPICSCYAGGKLSLDTSTAAFCIAASNIEKEEKEILKTRKKKGEFSFLQRDPKTLPFFGDQPTLFSSLGSFSQ